MCKDTIFQRYLSLPIAIWMIIDMALDVCQTWKYYKAAFRVHQTESRSPGYFAVSVASFIAPSILASIWYCLYHRKSKNCIASLSIPTSLIIINVIIPIDSIVAGCRRLVGEKDISSKHILFLSNFETCLGQEKRLCYGTLPALNLFEQFGEAVPQVILACLFSINGSPDQWMPENVLTLISIIFSCGSIIFGIVFGCSSWIKYKYSTKGS